MRPAREELDAKAFEQAKLWVSNLSLQVDGAPLRPTVRSVQLVIAETGAGSLPVLRITAKAFAASKPGTLRYEDRNYPDRAGWKEVVVDGEQPGRDLSKALTAYPEDATIAPPQDVTAEFTWRARVVEPRPSVSSAVPLEQPEIVLAQSPAAPVSQPGTVQRGMPCRNCWAARNWE